MISLSDFSFITILIGAGAVLVALIFFLLYLIFR
jgi:hypothetical protein